MTDVDHEYDVFITGETIDLVIPNKRAIYIDRWYEWFNSPDTTRYLEGLGSFPNSPEQQEVFLNHLQQSRARIALLIKPKGKDYVIGTVSLSNIDLVTRQADFALVIGRRSSEYRSVFYGMEAKCLLTEHAFEVMGLERINSGQSSELREWQKFQILFGYKIEGVKRKAFKKGYSLSDEIISSCLLEDYLELIELRDGHLWPGYKKTMVLIRSLPQVSLEERLRKATTEIMVSYSKEVRMI